MPTLEEMRASLREERAEEKPLSKVGKAFTKMSKAARLASGKLEEASRYWGVDSAEPKCRHCDVGNKRIIAASGEWIHVGDDWSEYCEAKIWPRGKVGPAASDILPLTSFELDAAISRHNPFGEEGHKIESVERFDGIEITDEPTGATAKTEYVNVDCECGAQVGIKALDRPDSSQMIKINWPLNPESLYFRISIVECSDPVGSREVVYDGELPTESSEFWLVPGKYRILMVARDHVVTTLAFEVKNEPMEINVPFPALDRNYDNP